MAEARSTDRGSPLRRLHERLLNPPLQTGSTRLLIARAADGFWTISEPAGSRPLRRVVSREQALTGATSTLAESRGGRIEVTEEDGSTQLISVPRGRRPWWQVTRTPLAGLLLGLVWLVLLVMRVLDSAWPPGWSLDTFIVVVTGLCAAYWLWSNAMRVVRGRRARSTSSASPRRDRPSD